ncbi:MAG: transcriptional repressor [Bacteroidetes bacterium]|jgi:Fur family ferric uptake transcriptional regulator|nr:transcriptional repressor [Bacteroidota bacterium]
MAAPNLNKAGLRSTPARQRILEYLNQHERALALTDLERDLSDAGDRATLYRTLKSFEDAGVVHKVVGLDGVIRFALCESACRLHHAHFHTHAHFSCQNCGHLTCLQEIELPRIELPEGYTTDDVQLVFSGTCQHCAKP